MENGVKVFHLVAEPVKREFLPGQMGKVVDAWGYNGSMPGPTIKVTEGDRVRLEVHRVELSLQACLAVSYKNYIDSVTLAERYHKELLPRTQQAYDLYLAKYKQRAAAYPQVLIAQRTLFQLRVDYVASLENAWHAVVELRGFLLGDGLEQPLSPRRTSGSQSPADE